MPFFINDNGLNLHYIHSKNSGSDSLCLLLHGFTNDAHIWDGLNKRLQSRHHVIAFDFRGHGDSDWDSQARYHHNDLINDTQELVQLLKERLHYKKLHIIGHSLGARIAILWLTRHGIQASSLSIIDTGPEVRSIGVNKVRKDAEATPRSFNNHREFQNYLHNIYLLAEPERIALIAKHGLKEINGDLCPKTDPAFTKALWKQNSTDDHDTAERYGGALTAPLNEELWHALPKIQCPVLILKGQASAILSKKVAQKMLALLPQAELFIIERAGHALMVDNANGFEEKQLAFIDHCSS